MKQLSASHVSKMQNSRIMQTTNERENGRLQSSRRVHFEFNQRLDSVDTMTDSIHHKGRLSALCLTAITAAVVGGVLSPLLVASQAYHSSKTKSCTLDLQEFIVACYQTSVLGAMCAAWWAAAKMYTDEELLKLLDNI